MEIASNQWIYNNLEYKLHNIINNCKIKNLKHTLYELTENISDSKNITYLGEYNENDIMF